MKSNETTKARMGNTILELIIFACEGEVENSEGGQAAHKEVVKLTDALSLEYAAGMALEMAISELYMLYAEQMFMHAWKLRGNPDLLAEFIGPE